MEKKQTAVEWLFQQYVETAGIISVQDVEKALAMEREQIEEAHLAYRHNRTRKESEDYYTKIYGK